MFCFIVSNRTDNRWYPPLIKNVLAVISRGNISSGVVIPSRANIVSSSWYPVSWWFRSSSVVCIWWVSLHPSCRSRTPWYDMNVYWWLKKFHIPHQSIITLMISITSWYDDLIFSLYPKRHHTAIGFVMSVCLFIYFILKSIKYCISCGKSNPNTLALFGNRDQLVNHGMVLISRHFGPSLVTMMSTRPYCVHQTAW